MNPRNVGPDLIVEAFRSPKALEHCVGDLRGEVSASGRGRFLTWLRQARPTLFRELPRSLREEVERNW